MEREDKGHENREKVGRERKGTKGNWSENEGREYKGIKGRERRYSDSR